MLLMGNFRSDLGNFGLWIEMSKETNLWKWGSFEGFFPNLRATDLATLCTIIGIASQFAYGWGHRPAKSGWLLFRSELKYIEIEADDRRVLLLLLLLMLLLLLLLLLLMYLAALFAGTGHFLDRPVRCVYGGLYLHDRYTIKLWWPFESFFLCASHQHQD